MFKVRGKSEMYVDIEKVGFVLIRTSCDENGVLTDRQTRFDVMLSF